MGIVTEAFFQVSITCVVGDGQSTRFWTNPWLGSHCITVLTPELLAAIPGHAHRQRMMASALDGHVWIRDNTNALMVPVLMQYLTLRQHLDDIALSSGIANKLVWKWTASSQYSSSSVYAAMFLGQSAL
jgi:hypothetical protein